MKYKVITAFTDAKDNGYAYVAGDDYPREGLEVDEKRIAFLQKEQEALGGRPALEPAEEEAPNDDETQEPELEDLKVDELKEIAKELEVEDYASMKKAELIKAIQEK